MMRSLLLLLLLATATHGQCPPGVVCPIGETPSAVLLQAARVRHAQSSGASIGTATLIAHGDGVSYWITCGHVFDDGPGLTSLERGGASLPARVTRIDRANDLSLLETVRVRTEPIGYAVQPTRELTVGGFGQTGQWRAVRGSIVRYATASGATDPSVVIAGAVRPGDSGGPVLDTRGRLCGVVWGQRDGQTYATCGRPLRRILSGVLRKPRSQPSQGVVTRPASEPTARPQQMPSVPENRRIPAPVVDSGAEWRAATDRRLATIDDQLQGVVSEERFQNEHQEVRSRLDRLREIVAPIGSKLAGLSKIATRAKQWTGTDLALGGLGLSGPLGLAWVAVRLLKRRGERTAAASRALPVAVDSPPPPQRVVPETHYVAYEQDAFAKAHQWASEQLVRKYPGSVEWLSGLNSLIKQQLAGSQRTD